MLIDDDEVSNFLNTLLIQQSFDVHIEIAQNGLKALNYLTSLGKTDNNDLHMKPGLIFLDINMPRMNGWEFLDAYFQLKNKRNSQPVIAMLTSSINEDDYKKAIEKYHLNEYIIKPLTDEKLAELINKYFPGSSSSNKQD